MEQTLGHVTHYRNMRAAIDAIPEVAASWYPLTFPPRSGLETLPPLRSNWSMRASWRARRLLAQDVPHTALFFHTQVTTLLSVPLIRRVPSVISLDATPINYDAVGAAYGHRAAVAPVERLKRVLHARPLRAAGALVTWCDWARRSLIEDYGVQSERISVIPPGVDLAHWPRPRAAERTGPAQILFVGGDFARKGGMELLHAFAARRDRAELHLVSKAAPDGGPGVRVYRDLGPNSAELKRLYSLADLFVLPTRADCFPLVIQEAMAAGLPVIASDVGALGEAVDHGVTGLLVPPGDSGALGAALDTLLGDSGLRQRMGQQARATAERRFDSAANARAIVQLLLDLLERS